jgi:hypothetical protein
MSPWSTNPYWQSIPSLYREVVAAKEAPNEIRKFHHLISSLYFGIVTLEAFKPKGENAPFKRQG